VLDVRSRRDDVAGVRRGRQQAWLSLGGGAPARRPSRDRQQRVPADTRYEVFSPPYLFASDGTPAPRPQITSLPAQVHHGHDFTIQTPSPSKIAKVVLVRPMAVTHQTDSEQRVIQLTLQTTGPTGSVSVRHYPGGRSGCGLEETPAIYLAAEAGLVHVANPPLGWHAATLRARPTVVNRPRRGSAR
jgi:hypothetical protein